MKHVDSWYSDRVGQEVTLVRWGETGIPVLVFPTAGGDAEEIERFLIIDALAGLLAEGRIKVYSIDSVAGRSLLQHQDPRHVSWQFNAFSSVLRQEIVPAIWADCGSNELEMISAGASIGAFNALAAICRHPDVFKVAVAMSGTYDLSDHFQGPFTDDFYFSSPLHYLPDLEGPHLEAIKQRMVIFATGAGKWESPEQSWSAASCLGNKGIPNRVDVWSEDHHHDWVTWREMLPKYLDDLTAS